MRLYRPFNAGVCDVVSFEHDESKRVLTVRLSGELHTNVCMQLDGQVAARISSFLETPKGAGEKPFVVLDMKDVPYASSFFVRIVLSAVHRLGREQVSLIHCNEFLQGLFKTVGLKELLAT